MACSSCIGHLLHSEVRLETGMPMIPDANLGSLVVLSTRVGAEHLLVCQHIIAIHSPSSTQKNSKSRCFSLSRYLSLNSSLVNHLESGIIVSFMSRTPLFFWSMYEASTTIRFKYSTESDPA